jgi:predicted esterase
MRRPFHRLAAAIATAVPPTVLVMLVMLVMLTSLRADGPADNLPAAVRPIPPVGIELDDATRTRLQDAVVALTRDVDAATTASDADRAEVLVFARAVQLAVEDRFFYDPKEIEQAERLLDYARKRLGMLAQGGRGPLIVDDAAGAPAKPRLTVGGFRSRIDGSIQPYGLVLPADFDVSDTKPRRLDIWLHGRGEKVGEVQFLHQRLNDAGPIVPANTIVLHPYGRYCNAFKFAGEVDVLEAIAHVKTLLPIDDDRVTIRGFSMGGAGCWQLAVHYPGTWLAATPGAGFSETIAFLRGFQQEDFNPGEPQRSLLHWYDCPDWADNLRHLPTIAYSGELDRQKQAADAMEAACKERGFTIPHVIGPQTGHKIHPDSLTAIEEFVAVQAAGGRPATPAEIDFTTYTLRYPTHTWLTIEGLGEHWRKARVQAQARRPASIEITTTNVTRLRLDIPRASQLLDFEAPVEVRIDGSTVTVPPTPGSRWEAAFITADGGWQRDETSKQNPQQNPQQDSTLLRKRPGLQGPIDDAFMEPFLFVGPEATPDEASPVEVWAREEYARAIREWRRHFRGDVIERKAADVSAQDIADRNLILFGTADSNPLITRVMPGLPLRRDGDAWSIGPHRVDAAAAVPILIYPNPLNPDRSIVLNSGFTFREYAYLNNARQIPMLPDWAIVSATEGHGPQVPGRILASGFFDERWQPK